MREKNLGGREGVKDGCVKWVAQMSSPVVEWAFACGRSLHGEAEEGNHGETGVLDFCQLEGGPLLRVGGQAKRVKELASRVQPLLGVQLCIPLELNVSDHKHFNPY